MKYVIKESVDARGHTRRTKKDTALVIIQNQEAINLKQEDLILYVIYLYATSRVLAYGGCVHITSGSQNQAVLPKRHDYIQEIIKARE